jgi:Protein of unknown function (DUF3102)
MRHKRAEPGLRLTAHAQEAPREADDPWLNDAFVECHHINQPKAIAIPTESKDELVVVGTFEYGSLETNVADQVQSAAHRIRECMLRTLAGIIGVGSELRAVKDALPHGQFSRWLRAEFGWTERTARNFMAVAERFGPKTEIISEMRIDPTAAYLLAAPSAPDKARQAAVQRAEGGERITTNVAKDILAMARKKAMGKTGVTSTEQLGERLTKALQRFRQRWDARKLSDFGRRLREFADSLEAGQAGSKNRSRKERE